MVLLAQRGEIHEFCWMEAALESSFYRLVVCRAHLSDGHQAQQELPYPRERQQGTSAQGEGITVVVVQPLTGTGLSLEVTRGSQPRNTELTGQVWCPVTAEEPHHAPAALSGQQRPRDGCRWILPEVWGECKGKCGILATSTMLKVALTPGHVPSQPARAARRMLPGKEENKAAPTPGPGVSQCTAVLSQIHPRAPPPEPAALSPLSPIPRLPSRGSSPAVAWVGPCGARAVQEVRHHKAGFSRFHLMSCAYISIHLLMSMVRMCVMPGLEKSTPRLTVGARTLSKISSKISSGWGWAV